jgi:hypothetical protein
MDIHPRHNHNFRVAVVFVAILAFGVFGFTERVIAAETYVAESDIVIGEYIYADDYSPTTDNCWVTIKNPSGTTVVSHALMSADADGWHHYSYTLSALEGKWPAFIECGTALAGDLLKVDKTFLVKAPEVTNDSVASSVWGAASRTLTSGVSIASDIWSATSRSLTSFGSLVSDVWSDTYAPIRRLTDATLTNGGTIAVVNDIAVTNSLISSLNNISAADVW